MKWLVCADIHVHQHKKSSERLQDCLNALDWIFRTAVEKAVDHIIVVGDLFYDRFKIDVPTYQKTFEIFKKYTDKHDFGVWLLIGNHDMFMHKEWDISSMVPLSGIPSVTVINKPCILEIGETPAAFLPYTTDPISDLAKIEEKLGSWSPPPEVLFGHVALDNAVLNPLYNTKSEVHLENDGDMVKVDSEIFKKWKQVFLGHYHAAQTIGGNVEYVGSPLQLSFGEAFQPKHVIIYHPTTDIKEYVDNDFSPKHFIIKRDEIDQHDVAGNFVKLIVESIDETGLANVRKEFLEELGAKTFDVKSPDNGKSVVDDEVTIENARAILDNEFAIFERFVNKLEEKDSLGGLKKDLLFKLCQKVIDEARKREEGKDETHAEVEL